MEPGKVETHHFPRKDMLTLALTLRPGVDFILVGSWNDPQILMDLSSVELAYAQVMLRKLRLFIDMATEQDLILALIAKMEIAGDPASRVFHESNRL